MSIVAEVKEFRGVMEISTEEGGSLRVRKKHFMMHPVGAGDEIDAEAYEDAIAAAQFADAYEAALTALDFCARTEKEIVTGLLRKGYVPKAARSVAERLREGGLINDRQMAARIAESNAGKAVGVYALKRKLRAKGISEEDASEALEAFDDGQQAAAAKAAAEKLLRRYNGLPARDARAKLSQALARRGFGADPHVYTVEAARDEVLRLLSKGGAPRC